MHPELKRHCRQELQVYRCTDIVDGDKEFAPVELLGTKVYAEPKIQMVLDVTGLEVRSDTRIFVDGIESLGQNDEVELPIIGRRSILSIQAFPSLNPAELYDHLEVLV